MEKIENISDIEIKQKIIKDSKLIFSKHPEEKYRRNPIGREIVYPIKDYINFTVFSQKLKKEIKLKTYMFLPENSEIDYKGIIYLFNGMTAHSETAAFIAKDFSTTGCVIVSFDNRGQGLSEGENGNIENFGDIIKDSQQFMYETEQYFKKMYKDKNIEDYDNKIKFLKNKFIGGISMGGLMCYYLSKNNPNEYKGVMFFAPALDIQQNWITKKLIKFAGWLYPSYVLNLIGKEALAFKNPQAFEDMDPIIKNTKTQINTVKTLLDYSEKDKDYKNYSCPFVIIIPGVDKLVPPKSMFDFYEASSSKDKQCWYYENCWHAVYVEEEIFEITKRLVKWIKDRL